MAAPSLNCLESSIRRPSSFLSVPRDIPWNVGFFQILDFLRAQCDFECTQGIIQIFHFCRADQRGGDVVFAQHPGSRDLSAGDAALIGQFMDP